jgi:hypothetical protein
VLYSNLRLKGKHYIERGSDATAKAFMTIDIGAEREVLPRYIIAFGEIRNLLNSSGAWWTEEYGIPGIGFYIGLRAKY